MNLAQSLTATDTEMSGVLTGARSLEHLTDNGTVSIDSMGKLTIQTSTDTYKVEQYSSTQVAKIVRVTTNHGGFMPVMRRVQKFSAVKIGAETVEYTVQTLSGKTFVGILMSRGGEQVEKKR